MNNTVKVSIIVPVYNVEKYLRQCINSLITQTLEDIEIICVNDGSTDASLEILNEYASRDERVRVISKQNTGYGNTMNIGFSAARGEYIGIVESDDYALPEMFASLYDCAKKHDADLVKSNYFAYKQDAGLNFVEVLKGVPYERVFCPQECVEIQQMTGSCIWSAIYKREFIQENHIVFHETPGASYQDLSFQMLTLLYAKRMVAMKDAFLCYRTDNENSSVKSKEKVFFVMEEFNRWEEFASKEKKEDMIKKSYPKKYVNYIGNYYRVDDLFKYAYVIRMAQEFQRDMERGWLEFAHWKKEDWEQMNFIRTNPMEFYKETCESYFDKYVVGPYIYNEEAKQNGVKETLKNASQIIIYGAGKYGLAVYQNVKEYIDVFCFAVSDEKTAQESIDGVKIKGIDTLLEYKETSVVIVAVRKALQKEIVEKLRGYGFSKVLVVDSDYKF